MEHLTKQQIVLLTLLVSFVTSIATGIITVSLMDQAPQAFTQTINRVIERVVVETPKANTATAAVSYESMTAKAVEKVGKSVVRFKPTNGSDESVTGLGLILTSDGLALVNKSSLSLPSQNTLGQGIVAQVATGEEYPIQVIQSEILGDVAFVALLIPRATALTPVTQAPATPSLSLGTMIYSLTGKRSFRLEDGFVKALPDSPSDRIETSLAPQRLLPGSPLFTINGEIVGFKTYSTVGDSTFYPTATLKSVTPTFSR